MTAALATLNPAALVALTDCEQRIERGLKTFIDVGQALAEIRDSRLYKGSHDTFEDYCRERWGFSRQRAQQFTAAAELATTMVDTGLPTPTNERQTRELAKVPEAERADVWAEAVERTDGKPTAKAISEVAAERAQTPGPEETYGQLAERVWASLDLYGNRPYGLTIGEIQANLRDLTHDQIRRALAELAAERRAYVMSHAAGTGPAEDRARWLNKRLTPAERIADVAAVAPEFVRPVETPAPAADAPVPPQEPVPAETDEQRAAERRDARTRLRRAVDLLVPAAPQPDFIEAWVGRLGEYDSELSELVTRATAAINVLDELIERCGR